jgi:catechol 2,3-dioxygenase-like lactoylglutathione lyase family enzyme
MLDHVGLRVLDYSRSKRFFESALAPLGYKLVLEFRGFMAGFGAEGKPDFWISQGEPVARIHVAFRSPDRATVDAFHEAALAADAGDNGPPGIRPEYHADYYAAYVHDPDGNNIEAVCHQPA